MSFATFINNEEMTFRQGVIIVLGWLALMGVVGVIVAYFSLGV